MSDEMNVFQRQ